jgi:hypothetical protein
MIRKVRKSNGERLFDWNSGQGQSFNDCPGPIQSNDDDDDDDDDDGVYRQLVSLKLTTSSSNLQLHR